jgi:hypothetical protein
VPGHGDLPRTTEGEVAVHVVYRRVDDEYLDPLHFRPDSMLGCPGLVNAARAGRVAIANGIGNGIADDKLVYTYVPDMIRFYLDEDPLLPNVETFRLTDTDQRAEALGRIGDLVWKRVDGSGGKGLVTGPDARRGAPIAPRPGRRRAEGVDSTAPRTFLHGPELGRQVARGPTRRPAALCGQRRRTCLGAPGRSHQGRPVEGQPRRQLLAGGRLEGHLGPRPGGAPSGARERPRRATPHRDEVRRAELEFLSPGRILEDLSSRLARVHEACSRASDSMACQYFAEGPATLWRHETGTR